MPERWIDNWETCDREIESWLDDPQLLAELGRRCALAMLGCHPSLDRADLATPLLLRRLLATDWLGPVFGGDSAGPANQPVNEVVASDR